MKNIILLVFTVLILGCNSKKKREETISTSHEKIDLSDSPLFNTEIVEPTKLFDNIYFVGYGGVGAFIVNTTQGIILIDAMWTNNDAKNVIIPGIEKLGLNPKDIKYLLVTHEHADHYGGANFIEKTYKSKILMSEVAWNGLQDPNALVLVDPFGNKSSDLPLPQSYQKVDDKEIISLGETNIRVLLTPGHTKGAISLVINTTDNNINHAVSIWGGTGLPNTLEENKKYLKSLNYFESFAIKNGVDAQISNHPFVNNLLDDMKLLKSRKSTEKNPLILTTEEFKRNIDTTLRKSVIEKIKSYQ
ncbi:MBL fold metallo-hydrolase [Zobellia russellii]|uniref:MBL fold metallo-hydrolase n=1 Tax=Zobellia russellii TaxID=248907 RepID=UPI001BFF6D4B|nr:MBL fold metallo-hydrolase [Zobellia russellii]MBT9189124.1 MBL fold metallo-hydrolase [Zobellia russellii]